MLSGPVTRALGRMSRWLLWVTVGASAIAVMAVLTRHLFVELAATVIGGLAFVISRQMEILRWKTRYQNAEQVAVSLRVFVYMHKAAPLLKLYAQGQDGRHYKRLTLYQELMILDLAHDHMGWDYRDQSLVPIERGACEQEPPQEEQRQPDQTVA